VYQKQYNAFVDFVVIVVLLLFSFSAAAELLVDVVQITVMLKG